VSGDGDANSAAAIAGKPGSHGMSPCLPNDRLPALLGIPMSSSDH